MNIELDHPTITHLLGYLTEEKWADAIRQKSVNVNIAWELLRIQDQRYNGNMTEQVKEIVEMSDADYTEYRKSIQK
jgi:formiminotetrahydrofolate cyclodeaminase